MTLVEFLQPVWRGGQRDLVLAVMYYLWRYQGEKAVNVGQIRSALARARHPSVKATARSRGMNISYVLDRRCGHYVHTTGSEGTRLLWALTDAGTQHVRELLGLPEAEPEIEYDVGALTVLADKVRDEDVREYLQEAIRCLSVGGLRAAIVFVWAAAIRTLQERALEHGVDPVTAAVQKQDANAREIRTLDDFAYVKDRKFLDATRDLGILDKSQKDTLVEALNLRNRCGHPAKYRPREARAKAFIEDVVGIVFRS